jgi:hypothetical protein
MTSENKNSAKSARQRRLAAAARKKAIIAVCLIVVMAFMWVRIFTKKGDKTQPVKAAASTVRTVSASTKANPKMTTMKYKQLPMIEGRNDVLVRDIFSLQAWLDGKGTADDWNSKQKLLAADIRRAGKALKLEAIIMGEGEQKSEIFISDKLVPAGSDFPTKYKGRVYRFMVESITANKVVLKCKDVVVTLKLAEN